MGLITNPPDIVLKTICMPRWQREWIQSHNAINFSGLIQEIVTQLIKEHDPLYFEANQQYLRKAERHDGIRILLQIHPSIVPVTGAV